MKEIKFRGCRVDQNKWLHGDLLHIDGKPLISDPSVKIGFDKAFVDPETVGQYTGVKDRTGKDIYEGDILMFHAFLPDVLQERHLVGWSEDYGFCQWEYVDKEDSKGNIKRIKRSEPYTLYGVSHGTIIGNIHDNPELLEKKGGEI